MISMTSTATCPAWCRDADHDDDATHGDHLVHLLATGLGGGPDVDVIQLDDDPPHVEILIGGDRYSLTPAEAKSLAAALMRAAGHCASVAA